MNRVISLTDEQYRTIEEAARLRGETPDTLLAHLIEELRDPRSNPRYYETDAWLRHLGMRADVVSEIEDAIQAEHECPHDADA
jgi:hypothetical protein